MSAYDPPQCQICVDRWEHLGRPADKYLIVSRGNHIPGVPHGSQSAPAKDEGGSVKPYSSEDSERTSGSSSSLGGQPSFTAVPSGFLVGRTRPVLLAARRRRRSEPVDAHHYWKSLSKLAPPPEKPKAPLPLEKLKQPAPPPPEASPPPPKPASPPPRPKKLKELKESAPPLPPLEKPKEPAPPPPEKLKQLDKPKTPAPPPPPSKKLEEPMPPPQLPKKSKEPAPLPPLPKKPPRPQPPLEKPTKQVPLQRPMPMPEKRPELASLLPPVTCPFCDETRPIYDSYLAPSHIGIDIRRHENEADRSDSSTVSGQRDKSTFHKHLKLHKAALTGNWEAFEEIHGSVVQPHEFNKQITLRGETALHIATMAGQTEFAKKLIKKMRNEGLDVVDHTALSHAVINGNEEIVKAILDKHDNMALRRDEGGLLPIHRAAFSGRNRGLVAYLYKLTINHMEDQDIPDLLVALIEADIFDLMLDVAEQKCFREDHATRGCKYTGDTAFHAMAQKPKMFPKTVNCWRKLFYPSSQDVQNCRARDLLERIWFSMLLDREPLQVEENWRTIFVAVEQGNLEFLRVLIRNCPDLVTKTNHRGWTIFHAAIAHRQEKIFALIHEIGSLKNLVANCLGEGGKNMLHLAAQLAPESCLETTPGAALQLRLELLWFQEVKDVVGPHLAKARAIKPDDKDQLTPNELFVQNHEDLIKKGEEWMRNTANSCILVAILVATVAFAAAFTLPGGNDQTIGIPIILHRDSFKIFAIADAISFICSAISVLTFLSVLTSTYALNDFVRSLPLRLLVGLSTLFVSVMAMMAAFVTAFFIYFKQRMTLQFFYPLPMTMCTIVALILFSCFHFRIFFHVIKCICRFKRDSLFRVDHSDPLFPVAKVSTRKSSKYFTCFNCSLGGVRHAITGFKKCLFN